MCPVGLQTLRGRNRGPTTPPAGQPDAGQSPSISRWLRVRDSSCASTRLRRARSVNRSNIHRDYGHPVGGTAAWRGSSRPVRGSTARRRQSAHCAPRFSITSSPPTAQRRGKGGPEAHPAGTRSALPAAGAVGEAPAGMGTGAVTALANAIGFGSRGCDRCWSRRGSCRQTGASPVRSVPRRDLSMTYGAENQGS